MLARKLKQDQGNFGSLGAGRNGACSLAVRSSGASFQISVTINHFSAKETKTGYGCSPLTIWDYAEACGSKSWPDRETHGIEAWLRACFRSRSAYFARGAVSLWFLMRRFVIQRRRLANGGVTAMSTEPTYDGFDFKQDG
jgi:hypothetical protein